MMNQEHERLASKVGTNLEHAHLLNQRVVLEAIRLRGPVSRVDVARETRLTNQTIFNIVDGLRRADLVRKSGRKLSDRGQPAALFEINPDGTFSIGLHMERDHLAAVLIDLNGRIRTRAYRPDYFATPEDARKQALKAIRELRNKYSNKRISGLGIALPGPVDSKTGKVISMPNFPGWEQFDVQSYFQEKTGLTVLVDNDATAAAIGESWCGVGRTVRSFFYIYMGFGVGGGIILDGQPFRGSRGNSGEIGHIIVDRSKRAKRCGCGKVGCLETRTSLRSLYQHLGDQLLGNDTFSQLTELFQSGNDSLFEWLERATYFVTVTLRDLQLLFDPEAFVIGGHLPQPLLSYICECCARSIESANPAQGTNNPKILQGLLNDEAAAIGAAALPTHSLITPNYESITNGNHSNLLTLA
jgi:predicted NBD/HSP70 family sugar kinase